MSATPRSQQRRGFAPEVRMTLLEDDIDQNQEAMEHIAASVDAMRKLLVGILVSVTTASLLLVVNVVILGSR